MGWRALYPGQLQGPPEPGLMCFLSGEKDSGLETMVWEVAGMCSQVSRRPKAASLGCLSWGTVSSVHGSVLGTTTRSRVWLCEEAPLVS